ERWKQQHLDADRKAERRTHHSYRGVHDNREATHDTTLPGRHPCRLARRRDQYSVSPRLAASWGLVYPAISNHCKTSVYLTDDRNSMFREKRRIASYLSNRR